MRYLSKVLSVIFLLCSGCDVAVQGLGSQDSEDSANESSLLSRVGQQRDFLLVDRFQRMVMDAKGQALALRGMQVPLGFRTTQKSSQDPEVVKKISEYGFNMVRITWSSVANEDYDIRFEELQKFLEQASKQGLIVMLEAHNVTGKNVGLEQVVQYWVSLYPRLKPYQHFLMLNIANEWGGNDLGKYQFRSQYREAVRKLRAAGYRIPLVIDAAGWGQDMTYLTDEDFWRQLLDADQAIMGFANLMFSVHLYGKWGLYRGDQGAPFGLRDDFVGFAYKAPLFLGEFGWAKPGNPDQSKIALPDLIQTITDNRLHVNIYSWSGNNPHYRVPETGAVIDYRYLDFVPSDYVYGQSLNGLSAITEYRFRNHELNEYGAQFIKQGRLVVADRKADFLPQGR